MDKRKIRWYVRLLIFLSLKKSGKNSGQILRSQKFLAYNFYTQIESKFYIRSIFLFQNSVLNKIFGIFLGLSGAHAAWEGLADRLERHKAVVARQLEDAKINLRHRGIALKDERERWEARWSSKSEKIDLDWISSMRERWVTLEEQKQLLLLDCQGVGIELNDILEEDLELSRKYEAELEAEESNCRFQEEFLNELENQEAEEWTVARRRLHRLHDWLDSWEARIKVQKKNSGSLKDDSESDKKELYEIDTFVGRKIKEIRGKVEWIQLLRGDEIAEEHWNDLRPIINIEGNIRDITLGTLLNAASKIQDNVDKVKVRNNFSRIFFSTHSRDDYSQSLQQNFYNNFLKNIINNVIFHRK